jgi:flagellar hook-associated protein 1 FlgK
MSGSALMSIGLRAMLANQGAMQTVGHNIANASVDGYSRQQVELNTSQGQFTGAGFFGKGVDVQTVTRTYNEFLTRQASVTRSQAAYDETRRDQLTRLESVFKGGEDGLGAATGDLLNAMVDVASRPQDLSARQVVLARAGDLANRFAAAGAELDDLQTGVTQDLKNSVTHVNELAVRIAGVNDRIASLQGSGHAPNDLLDQRDQLIGELSGYLQVTTIPADDGTVGVFIAGGQRLVLGAQSLALTVAPDTFDNTRMALAIQEAGGARALDENLLGAGSMGGLLRFQNQDLVDARNLVGQLASAVAITVNQQQALGLDLGTPASAGAPMFSIGTPRALPASGNARDPSGSFSAEVTLMVDDPRQLVASEYSLDHDGTGWQLTRLADGLVRGVASGDVVDGLRIDLGAPPPAVTDRFLLQPLTRAANGMARVLDNPRGLAAASPVTASVSPTNTGTASVAALTVVDPAIDPQLTASITFTTGSGDYTWELRDRTTNALAASGSATWTAGQSIALNGFELQLAGVPRSGDAFSVSKTAYPAANNGNALTLAGLGDLRLVGLVPDASGALSQGQTFTDAWAGALADIGVRVQGAKSAAEMSTQVASGAKQALAGYSGVNLDEEAARLMQFQQGYQAAAKVLQIAQSLFDTLLQTAG